MRYEVRRVPGEATLADAYAVRRAVFIEEQGVSEAEEMDGLDEQSIHFVAYAVGSNGDPPSRADGDEDEGSEEGAGGDEDEEPSSRADEDEAEGSEEGVGGASAERAGQPVGTARLRIPEPGVAKPERVAVLESHRGEGVGRQLMAAIEREAREQGCERARLHAQVAVEAFYRDLGYETTSGVFEEADIPHVEMEKEL